jgi:hypothetical protein
MTIRTITPTQAAERLRQAGVSTSAERIRHGLEQGVYPFGEAVQMEKGYSYTIYEKLFDAYMEERAG